MIVAITLAVAAATANAGSTDGPPGNTVLTLRGGTSVVLMAMAEVSSQRSNAGDIVKFKVNEPVLVSGKIVVPKGTPAFGIVAPGATGGAALRAGTITVRPEYLIVNGTRIALTGDLFRRGKGGRNDDAIKAAFAPMYALFSPGVAGKIKAGEIVEVRTTEDYVLSAATPMDPPLAK